MIAFIFPAIHLPAQLTLCSLHGRNSTYFTPYKALYYIRGMAGHSHENNEIGASHSYDVDCIKLHVH